jgi:hypothetical protein
MFYLDFAAARLGLGALGARLGPPKLGGPKSITSNPLFSITKFGVQVAIWAISRTKHCDKVIGTTNEPFTTLTFHFVCGEQLPVSRYTPSLSTLCEYV